MYHIVKEELEVPEWDLQPPAHSLERGWRQHPGNTRERSMVAIQPSLRHRLFLAAWVHLLSLRLRFTAWKSSSRHWHLGNISHFKFGRRKAVGCSSSFLPQRTPMQSYGVSRFLKSNFPLWFHSFSMHARLLCTKPDLELRLSPSTPFALPLPKHMKHRVNPFALVTFYFLWPQNGTP